VRSIPEIEMVLPRKRVVVPEECSMAGSVWIRDIPGSRYVLVTIEAPLEVAPLPFEQVKPYLERFLLPELVAELHNIVGLSVHQYTLENEQALIAVVAAEHIKYNLLFVPPLL